MSSTKPRNFKLLNTSLINGIFIMGLLLLSVDCVGNNETVFKFFGFHSHFLVIPILLFLVVARFSNSFILPLVIKRFGWILFGFSAFLNSVLIIFDAVSPANTVYALTRVNTASFLTFVIYLGGALFIGQDNEWWQKYWQKVLLLFPLVGFFIAILTRLLPFDVFLQLVKEDYLIENTQFWVLFLGSLVSVRFAWLLKQQNNLRWSIFFLFCFLGLFFIAGEEISWGQRLFKIEVSETIKQINAQKEMTVHNLYFFQDIVVYVYVTFSIFGVFSNALCSKVTFFKKFKWMVPQANLIGYFLMPLVFFSAQVCAKHGLWHPWAEVAELYLYLGGVLWVLFLGSSAQGSRLKNV